MAVYILATVAVLAVLSTVIASGVVALGNDAEDRFDDVGSAIS